MCKIRKLLLIYCFVLTPSIVFGKDFPDSFKEMSAISNIINNWKPEYYKDIGKIKNQKDINYYNSAKLSRPFDGIKAFAIFDVLVLKTKDGLISIKQIQQSPLKFNVNGKIYGPIDRNNIYDSLFHKDKKSNHSILNLIFPFSHAKSDGKSGLRRRQE